MQFVKFVFSDPLEGLYAGFQARRGDTRRVDEVEVELCVPPKPLLEQAEHQFHVAGPQPLENLADVRVVYRLVQECWSKTLHLTVG